MTSNQAGMKKMMSPRVIWQGYRISCMKTARTLQCKLCMVERKEIMHRMKRNRELCLNDKSEIFSTCTCYCDFHCLNRRKQSDTEDGFVPEKSPKRNHESKKQRKSRKLTVNLIQSKNCQQSLCMTERTIKRKGKQPIIDTNEQGVPLTEPSKNQTRMELERMKEYIEGNSYRMHCGCCNPCA